MQLAWIQLNWFDIVLLLIVAWGAYRGFQKGFLRAFLRLIGLVVAFPVAGLLTPGAADYVERQWQVTAQLAGFLSRCITLPQQLAGLDLESVSITQLLETLKNHQLPDAYLQAVGRTFNELAAAASGHGVQTAGEFLYYAMAAVLLNTLLFLGLFLVVRGIFELLASGMSRRAGLGVLGLFDQLAGLAFGLLTAAGGLMLVLGVLSPALGLDALSVVSGAVSGSAVAQWLLRVFYTVSPWIVQASRLVPSIVSWQVVDHAKLG